MDDLSLKIYYTRGTLLFRAYTGFPGKLRKPKYFLLAESYKPGSKSLLAFYTTSQERRKRHKNHVVLRFSKMKKETIVRVEDNDPKNGQIRYLEIPIADLKGGRYENVSFESNLTDLDQAIKRSNLPKEIKARMLALEELPKITKIKKEPMMFWRVGSVVKNYK